MHSLRKKLLKSLIIKNFKGQELIINKFGPFIEGDEFTIISIENSLEALPGNICVLFKLNKMDTVHILDNNKIINVSIVDINQKYFAFSYAGGPKFVIGSTVFSSKFELQGIYSHSILDLHFVYRFEPIIAFLIRNQKTIDHAEDHLFGLV